MLFFIVDLFKITIKNIKHGDVSHLRIIGSKIFAKNVAPPNNKLIIQSHICKLLEYGERSNQYRI